MKLQLLELAQRVDIYQAEAHALQVAIVACQAAIVRDGPQPVPLEKMLHLRPLQRASDRLNRLLATHWPRYSKGCQYRFRPRKLRLEYDELLLLNSLYIQGHLTAQAPEARLNFRDICGRINQAAQSLNHYFQV